MRATLLSAMVVLSLAGCDSSDSTSAGPNPADAGTSHALTVVAGYGSGTFEAGAEVHVWAEVQPVTEVVAGWTGDAALLERPDEWHTTLIMPARDVTVEAEIDAGGAALEESTHQGASGLDRTVLRYAPANPRGLVLFFHGTSGSARMIEKPEARYLAALAIARGFAVLSTEAEEVVAGDLDGNEMIRWNPSLEDSNPDLNNLDALVESLVLEQFVPAGTPLVALGMSNGGAMSLSLGAVAASPVAATFPHLRFSAAISYCASGRTAAAAISTTPTAWLLCANDDNEQVENEQAQDNSDALAARGIATMVDAHPPSPLYDARFARVPGLDVDTSAAIVAELRSNGAVGPDDLFAISTDELVAATQADPSSYPALTSLPPGQLPLVRNQVRVMQAEHQLYSDWAARTLEFIEANL